MKPGKPLQRRTELKATKPLERRSELNRGGQLNRTGRLRAQSPKRQAENRVRRKVIHATFGDQPTCIAPGCTRWADDVHEPLTRARGGSITDPDNMTPLCRPHHDEVTFTEPAWAYELGLLRHSWDRGDAA